MDRGVSWYERSELLERKTGWVVRFVVAGRLTGGEGGKGGGGG